MASGTYDRPEPGTAVSRADLETRHEGKVKDQRKTEAKRREAYRLVDLRDGRMCRVCGVRNIQDHHHIRGRYGRNAEETSNIIAICRQCHDLRHVKRTLIITGNADQTLTFEQDGRTWHG